jgi:ABC-type transport system involved in multi-copper enzyme maturation permease subunit
VKIWALAANTFRGFLRDKLIIVFLILFACVVLLMMSPLLAFKAMRSTNGQAAQTMVLSLVSSITYLISGCGSLLAAWAAASGVAAEMKSGTILAVMARPVERWQFLIGKYCGVMLLMAAYTALMTGLTYLLMWIGGQHAAVAIWILVVYPMVRYAVYAAIAMLLVTVMHPLVAWAITVIVAALAMIVAPSGRSWSPHVEWLRKALYTILPSTGLLSENRFISITEASLKPMTWLDHLTALAYGLDCALVCLLLAMWSFHYRSLRRD